MIVSRDGGLKPPYRRRGGSANAATTEVALGRADVVVTGGSMTTSHLDQPGAGFAPHLISNGFFFEFIYLI